MTSESGAQSSGFAPTRGNESNWSSNAPVFSPEYYGSGLPGIYITRQEEQPTLEVTGRNCCHRYPGALIGASDLDAGSRAWNEIEADPDEDGSLALHYGSVYYNEGMNTQDAAFHEDRIDCFRAAELLYLWAAGKGNVQAYVNLGYVYSYDRCEGYYLHMDEHGERIADLQEFPRERRAYECFEVAANVGHPEALYKLGDMVASGRGCEASLERAVSLWEESFRISQEWDEPTWWGSAALRLGDAREEGKGCEQSFDQALKWFEHAENGLRIAVDSGSWFYEKPLARARAGRARCAQELG